MALFGKKKDDMDLPPLDLPELPPMPDDVPPGARMPMSAADRAEQMESSQLSPGRFFQPPMPIPEAPAPPPPSFAEPVAPSAPQQQELITEDIEKIAEQMIDEKWSKVLKILNQIKDWKKEIDMDFSRVRDEVAKMDKRLSDAQNALVGKVDDYNKSLKSVNVEIQAMGKVFEKIIPTFSDNVKELSSIVGRAKEVVKKRKKE